jgi:NADPH2:quinone reductase
MPHAIQIRQTGGPEVLNWTPVEVGDPGSGQVRLRQAAAGLNYIDVYHRTGYYSQPLPFIPGLEGAGIVEAIGQDVRGLKVGDRVAYAGPTGGYSEVRLIEADRLVRLPDAISFDQSAAMMLQGMTAQVLIRQVYPVKAGDLILVHAAAGGTGLILCQWAAALGATVIGTVSTEPRPNWLTPTNTPSSIPNRISWRKFPGSPAARNCRWSLIPSARTPSYARSIVYDHAD